MWSRLSCGIGVRPQFRPRMYREPGWWVYSPQCRACGRLVMFIDIFLGFRMVYTVIDLIIPKVLKYTFTRKTQNRLITANLRFVPFRSEIGIVWCWLSKVSNQIIYINIERHSFLSMQCQKQQGKMFARVPLSKKIAPKQPISSLSSQPGTQQLQSTVTRGGMNW